MSSVKRPHFTPYHRFQSKNTNILVAKLYSWVDLHLCVFPYCRVCFRIGHFCLFFGGHLLRETATVPWFRACTCFRVCVCVWLSMCVRERCFSCVSVCACACELVRLRNSLFCDFVSSIFVTAKNAVFIERNVAFTKTGIEMWRQNACVHMNDRTREFTPRVCSFKLFPREDTCSRLDRSVCNAYHKKKLFVVVEDQ